MQKLMAVSKYSKEQLFRYSWVEAITSGSLVKIDARKSPLQECQQEYHKSAAEGDSYRYKECLCGAADVVCPNVLRNESGKGTDMKLIGTNARKTKSFSAMPTLAEATTPRELRIDVMIKKDTVTWKSCAAIGRPKEMILRTAPFCLKSESFRGGKAGDAFWCISYRQWRRKKLLCLCNDCCQCRACCGHMKQSYKNQ